MAAQKPTAVERLARPLRGEIDARNRPVSSLPPVELANIVLRGEKITADVEEAITGGEFERSIEGASTVTLNVHDPHRALLNGRLLNREGPVDLKLDRFWFRLVRTSKQGPELQLTFEDREVAWLRGYRKPRRAYRDKITRAEFVLSMLREVKEGKIPFYIPELHKRQPIDGNAGAPGTRLREIKGKADRQPDSDKDRERGFVHGAKLQIKGVAADTNQLKQVNRSMKVALGLRASEHAILSMLVSGIGESGFRAIPNSAGSGYSGVFQADPDNVPSDDTEQQARCFLLGGKGFQAGGAIALAARGGLSPGTIATMVEASGEPGSFYDAYLSEAKSILAAYGGGVGVDGDGGTRTFERTVVKRYAFTRGTVKKKESSWAAAQRLAEEVGWRAFIVEGRFYFISEEDLFRSRPRLTLSEDTPGVEWIDFDWDTNLRVNEARVTCRADMWTADPGTVVKLEQCGPADGRWLVESMRRGLWDRAAEISLRKPLEDKPEPAPETATDRLSVGVPDRRANPLSGGAPAGSPWGGKFAIGGAYGTDRGDHIHSGLDVSVPCGTACIAPFDGTITYATETGFGTAGGMIHLQAPADIPGTSIKKGDKIGWGHIAKTVSSVGEKVRAGQRIATSGGSPCHVHFVYIRPGGGGNGIDGNSDPTSIARQLGGV